MKTDVVFVPVMLTAPPAPEALPTQSAAVQRSTIDIFPAKKVERQAVPTIHRTRSPLASQRTMLANTLMLTCS